MDLLALAKDLIAADTVSEKGTEAAVRILKPLYEAAGLEVTVQELLKNGVRHQNLFGRYPGTDPKGLLLVTHLDTVDTGPLELWTETDPHVLKQVGDKVYGLGSADTKLDAICKLFAVREFKGVPLRRSLALAGTYEEEVGCKGARAFVKSPLFQARFVACSEPSELVIIRAHKGYAVAEIDLSMDAPEPKGGPLENVEVDGKAAHSSTPHLGVNAIEKALAEYGDGQHGDIERFFGGSVANKVPARVSLDLRKPGGTPGRGAMAPLKLARALFALWRDLNLQQEPKVNPSFDPSTSVVNWGVCNLDGRGGNLTFDSRLLPGHDPEALTETFEKRAAALCREHGATLKIEFSRASHAMELQEPSELLDAARGACRDVGLPDTVQAKPTNTEAGVFASAGAEAIVFGPGRSTGNAHCANEHNQFSQMERAIPFYRALITRLCV